MKCLNLLMIPTNYCNMKCRYCFFDKKTKPQKYMSLSMVEHIMNITLPFYDEISFIWHGGEPLSMGIDFYKSVFDIQENHKRNLNVKIKNSVQSNLTLLNEEFATFLTNHNFGLGGSYDGINNELTRGNSEKILRGKSIFENAGGHCGLIFVASKLNIETFIDSYIWFKTQHLDFRINPYIGTDTELMLDYAYYTQKLIDLFDYWAFDTNTDISINTYEWIIDYILLQKKQVCSYTSCLGKWASIDYNGTIKPCNRMFSDEYSYGNVLEYKCFNQAFESKGFKNLIIQSIHRREKCKECQLFDYCSGGCNYIAMAENGGIENNMGNHCKHLIILYNYINDFLIKHKGDSLINPIIKKKYEISYKFSL